ncbi:MAG: hypothetical protein HY516_00470 [Candidatus Aenigmarchaeota archaeon]|nr:hypothetical protein [Candidatus Aenigmarchaeota archaeon]
MNAGRYGIVVPFAMFFYLLISGYKIIDPFPLTYDPALHSEIAGGVMRHSLIPSTWAPFADVMFTYPPLFHWMSYAISYTGIETYRSVILLGLFSYAFFPVAFYIYGSAFGRKEAVLFSFFGAVQASLIEVFAAGEYPQLLSMNLLVVMLYFLRKENYPVAAVFSGLVLLSHTFTALYAAVLITIHFFLSIRRNGKRTEIKSVLTFLSIALLVSLIWVPKYLQIADNAINRRWENTIWYYKAGFVGIDSINNWFFSLMPGARIGLMMFFFSVVGAAYAHKQRRYQLWVFLFTAAFTIFHIPGTQYKFPDMLAVAVPPLAAFGTVIAMKQTRRVQKFARFIMAGILFAFLFINPYTNATNLRNCCVSDDAPSNDEARLAMWLENTDKAPSVLVADGKYEVWFAVIANKYPMNPRVSELEVFTDKYREMVSDRQKLIGEMDLDSDLLDKWNVSYVVTEFDLKPPDFQLLKEENGTKLYKRYV